MTSAAEMSDPAATIDQGFKTLIITGRSKVLALLLSGMLWTVHYHTIALGVTGTICYDAIAAMTALGIPPSAQSHVISAWVHMTLNHTHGLVTQHCSLDAHLIAQAFQRPP